MDEVQHLFWDIGGLDDLQCTIHLELLPPSTKSLSRKDPILEGSYTLCYCAGSDSGRHPDMGLLAAVSILMIAVCSVIWKYIINM